MQQQELKPVTDWPLAERLQREFAAIGFYLSQHPLGAYAAPLKQLLITAAADLPSRLGPKYQPVKLAGVVMAVKSKVSPKGRFAFVTLSDASEAYEASIFDENLLNQHHDLLREGTLLYLEADGKSDDGGVRLIIQRLQKLEEKLVDARYKHMTCHVHNPQHLAQVKTMLGTPQPGATQIDLRVPVASGAVVLRLRERYLLTPQILQQMQALPGLKVEAA
jgi:DNA polymerase-3 subunit alpha